MKRKLLAWLLVLAIGISCVPVAALAQTLPEPEDIILTETEPVEETLPLEETEPAEEPLPTQEETTEATEETLLAEEAEPAEETLPDEELLLEEEPLSEAEEAVSTSEGRVLPEEIPDDFVAPFTYSGSELPNEGAALPSSYDSRNYSRVTSVKDQGSFGYCWAFSAMAVSESGLISSGKAGISVDLAERHLAHFVGRSAYDPLGNATGDSTTRYVEGGNGILTTFALANWVGAALESKYPYSKDPAGSSASAAMDDAYHLTNAYWLNALDTDNIKRYVMSNGAVGISYWHDDDNYSSVYKSYYNSTVTKTNHAVTIVGWDDNFSASKFKTNPGAKGAWLVKNSWGTSWGNSGYFWLSYQDAAINNPDREAFVYEMESSSNYDYNYHYDGSYGSTYYTVDSGYSIASVFTASGSASGQEEEIQAVGMAIASADTNYSIQIYHDPTNASRPNSGTAMLPSPQTGTTHAAGFYTVELDNPVRVKKGETFAVVVTLSKPGSNVSFFADSTYSYNDLYGNLAGVFTSHTEPNQTFIGNTSGYWQDLHGNGDAVRLKAYTKVVNASSTPGPLTGLSFAQTAVNMTVTKTFSQAPIKQPSDAQVSGYAWSSSDTTVATVNSSGTVTALKAGSATITVTATSAGRTFSASYRVTVTDGAILTGSCGPNLRCTLTSDGILTITGSGEMGDDYYGYEWPWDSYRSQIKAVNLPSGLTSIGDDAFKDCTALTSVTIPSNVDSIYNGAFQNCTGLTTVTIPDSVTFLGSDVFSGCKNLTSVSLSKNITTISSSLFKNCSSLTSVNIPQGVTAIEAYAFDSCKALTSMNIPQGVTSIGRYAFYSCDGLTSVSIPQGVTSIGDFAFEYCGALMSVKLPSSIMSIGNSAFGYCTSLTSVELPSSITSIGNWAFGYCTSLTSIELPSSITSIASSTFTNCTSLTSVALPSGITSIGLAAFSNCTSLTTVTIPGSVSSVDNAAFYKCSALEEITFEHAASDTLTIGARTFKESGLRSVSIPGCVTSIGEQAFYTCHKLESVSIADGVTCISDNMFYYCDKLAFVTIPESVTSIGTRAFCSCKALTSVVIPKGVTEIKSEAFDSCTKLAEITFHHGTTDNLTIGDEAFWQSQYGVSATQVRVPDMSNVHTAISGYDWAGGNRTVTYVSIVRIPNTINASDITLSGDNTKAVTVSLNASALGGAALSYRSDNPSVTVDSSGVVTIAKGFSGTVKITITAAATMEYFETTKDITVTVIPDPVPNTITASDITLTTDDTKAQTVPLNASALGGAALSYRSDNPSVTVDNSGVVTIPKGFIGTAKITITAAATTEYLETTTEITVTVRAYRTITYDANRGEGAPEAVTEEKGTVITISGIVPTRVDYRFLGWAVSRSATEAEYQPGDPYTLEENVTLYAVWRYDPRGIAIENPPETLTSGQSVTLKATAYPDEYASAPITFKLKNSSDSKYLAISGSRLTAKTVSQRVDDVTVVASARNDVVPSEEFKVSILPKVTKVDICQNEELVTNKTVLIDIGQGYTSLNAVVTPGDAAKDVTWKSSNPAIADVDEFGTVTFNENGRIGKVTITATATDGSRRAGKVTLSIVKAASSLEITNAQENIQGGQRLALRTNIANDRTVDRGVTWVLDEKYAAYASISASGVLTTKLVYEPVDIVVGAYPTANPSAYTDVGITIRPAAISVAIQDEDGNIADRNTILPLAIENTLELESSIYPADSFGTAVWKSSNPRIATVEDGEVTGIRAGLVTITCTYGGRSASVRVRVGIPVDSLEITNAPEEALRSGKTWTLKTYVTPEASYKAVTWRLADPADAAYCTVAANGRVTAKTVYDSHTVEIIAEAADGFGKSDSCNIDILPKTNNILIIEDINLKPVNGTTVLMEPGDIVRYSAKTGLDIWENFKSEEPVWRSSNPRVASIDANGTITALMAGTVRITATTADRRSATFTVKVATKVKTITVGVKNHLNPVLTSGKTLTLTALTDPNATDKRVTWSLECPSNNPKCATITSTGVLKAAAGLTSQVTVTVIATAADGSGTRSNPFEVTLYPAATGVNIKLDDRVVNGLTIVTSKKETALTAQVFPSAAQQDVIWKSSSTRIATVDENGNVAFLNAGKAGTVTITATAADGSRKVASFRLTYAPGK